ncbi:hypothetical protein Tco_0545170 [Tanacetum coccineum]
MSLITESTSSFIYRVSSTIQVRQVEGSLNRGLKRILLRHRVGEKRALGGGGKGASGKLKTRWSGPFTVTQVFPYGTVELSQNSGPNFKVNGHRLKHYFGGDVPQLDCPDCEDSRALSFVFHPQEFHILSFILGIQTRQYLSYVGIFGNGYSTKRNKKKAKKQTNPSTGWKGLSQNYVGWIASKESTMNLKAGFALGLLTQQAHFVVCSPKKHKLKVQDFGYK